MTCRSFSFKRQQTWHLRDYRAWQRRYLDWQFSQFDTIPSGGHGGGVSGNHKKCWWILKARIRDVFVFSRVVVSARLRGSPRNGSPILLHSLLPLSRSFYLLPFSVDLLSHQNCGIAFRGLGLVGRSVGRFKVAKAKVRTGRWRPGQTVRSGQKFRLRIRIGFHTWCAILAWVDMAFSMGVGGPDGLCGLRGLSSACVSLCF